MAKARADSSGKKTQAKSAKKPTTGVKKRPSKKEAVTRELVIANNSRRATAKSGVKKRPQPASRSMKLQKKQAQDSALEQLFRKTPTPAPETAGLGIILPPLMSLRSVNKAKAIAKLLDDETAETIRRISNIAALTFIVVGSAYSIFAIGLLTSEPQTASVVGSTVTAKTNSTSVDMASTATTAPRPIFTPASSLPSTITVDTEFAFSFSGVSNPSVLLKNVLTAKNISAAVRKTDDGSYVATISVEELESGTYKVVVIGRSDTTSSEYQQTAGTFTYQTTEEVTQPETDTTSTSIDESEPEDDEDTLDATTEVSNTNPISIPEEVATMNKKQFSLSLSETQFVKPTTVYLSAPNEVGKVEIYYKKQDSLVRQFLTSALRLGSVWYLTLDTTKLPNGEYELIAIGKRGDIAVESYPVPFSVKVPPFRTTYTESSVTTAKAKSDSSTSTDAPSSGGTDTTVESATVNAVSVSSPQRDFSELSLIPTGETSNSKPERIVTELLRDNKEDLQVLLRNYSVAQQANDPDMIRLAKEALDTIKTSITADSEATDSVASELDNRITSLASRIETFEQLRRGANDGLTGVDSDGDGISDFDEKSLFKTDPDNPDTDGDGFQDGVEIMRGYNARDDESEAILAYESPKDAIGLVRDDTLKITDVSPIVVNTDEGQAIQTKVSGYGLPNSFVTIYIFSTPVIVTVKTDDTGAYTYVFEKEIENGTHEVYVAVTDNAGELIAHSSPFSFVKQAEAFTLGSALPDTSVSATQDGQNPYGVVIGLAVLALGIILLMLGIGLQTPVINATTKQTA